MIGGEAVEHLIHRRDRLRLRQVVVPVEGAPVEAVGRREWNPVGLAEAHREDAGRLLVITEPVGTGRVRRVRVDADHHVAELEDLHDGRDADRREVEWIDRFQLHSFAEGRHLVIARRVEVLFVQEVELEEVHRGVVVVRVENSFTGNWKNFFN